MEVGADHVPATHALEAVAPVAAVPVQHAAERALGRVEVRAPAVVLEAGEDTRPAVQLDLDRHRSDEPRARGPHGVDSHEPDPRQGFAVHLVDVAEQLVAAAHPEDHGAVGGGGSQRVALAFDEVESGHALLAVLSTAHVEEVVGQGIDRVADVGRGDREPDAPPGAAIREDHQVAAVPVDVEAIRVQRADAELRSRSRHRAPA